MNENSDKTLWNYLKTQWHYMDRPIFCMIVLLVLSSLMMVFSATMYLTENTLSPDPWGYFFKQLFGVMIGLFLYSVAIICPFKVYRSKFMIYAFNTLLLLALLGTLIMGSIGGGAQSWLNLGPLRFQPSEFAKVGMVLMGAILGYDVIYPRKMNQKGRYILPLTSPIESLTSSKIYKGLKIVNQHPLASSLIISILIIFMILRQPDFGMAVILTATFVGMLIITSLPTRLAFSIYALAFGAYVAGIEVLTRYSDKLVAAGDYRFARLGSFVNPFNYAHDQGYQLIGAYLSFSRGGVFGVGIGQGLTKQWELPAGHTDFILAIFAEETGIIGVGIIVALIVLLIFRMFSWAKQTPNFYHHLVFTGLSLVYLLQVMINLGGVSGLFPLTGVTLPFVSYGGSSMMFSWFAMGVFQAFVIEDKKRRGAIKENDI